MKKQASHPDRLAELFHLSTRCLAKGDFSLASQVLTKAVALCPRNPELWVRLAQAQLGAGHPRAALKSLRQALLLDPADPDLNYNLGLVLHQTGNLNQAKGQLLKTLKLAPQHLPTLQTLGNILNLEDDPGAANFYHQGLKIAPKDPILLTGFGVLCWKKGELTRAKGMFQKAWKNSRQRAVDALCNLGNVYLDQGEIKSALKAFRLAIARDQRHKTARSNLLLALHYDSELNPRQIFNEHLCHAPTPGKVARTDKTSWRPKEKIKIGFVSPDFKDHSVAHFVTPLLEHLDKELFDVTLYSDVQQPDAITRRIQRAATHWRHCAGLTDDRLLAKIVNDQVDILVDLAGHTRGNRLSVFALKPAPIQVTWLGYPNTTGLTSIDYRLVDKITDPVGESDLLHTEQLYRLPRTFLSYDPLYPIPDLPPLSSPRQRPFCFGSFNPLAKLNQQVLALWGKILSQTPNSNLVLKSGRPLDEDSRERFLKRAAQAGLDPCRIMLLERIPDKLEHLKKYQEIDLALDPFPYNGTTTTCEALLMGVPVLSLEGDRHSARVGASILKTSALEDYLAKNKTEYIAIACQLARQGPNQERRQHVRQAFLQSELFKYQSFAKEMGDFFNKAVQNNIGNCA